MYCFYITTRVNVPFKVIDADIILSWELVVVLKLMRGRTLYN
jgi:hypothetical protein